MWYFWTSLKKLPETEGKLSPTSEIRRPVVGDKKSSFCCNVCCKSVNEEVTIKPCSACHAAKYRLSIFLGNAKRNIGSTIKRYVKQSVN